MWEIVILCILVALQTLGMFLRFVPPLRIILPHSDLFGLHRGTCRAEHEVVCPRCAFIFQEGSQAGAR